MERTPEDGVDVTYSCTFRFHSPYLFWVGGKGILARTSIRSREVHKLAEKKRADTLEIPWPSLSGLAFKIGMNSGQGANGGTRGCKKEAWAGYETLASLLTLI